MATDMTMKRASHSDETQPFGHASRMAMKAMNRKRRNQEDDVLPPRQAHSHVARKHVAAGRFKRTKTPSISGQSLPVNRLIEVLDHSSLSALLQTVMTHHPEIVQTVSKLAPKPSVSDTIELIKQKAQSVKANLPYRCDIESDYSYIRVKPHLTELLGCISDFVLDLLPPMESSLQNACIIFDMITTVIHELPNFSNREFQYTKTMAYEQIANSWLTVLNHHKCTEESEPTSDENAAGPNIEKSIEWLKSIEEMHLLEQVEKHNDASGNKYSALVEFVRAELDSFAQINNSMSNSNTGSIFSDLITVDYSGFSIPARTSH
ncbi:hypothetical protein OY671_006642 [Metschnikowia pulcherrima]|nr:hypothetical protein OY671_006642 [Metschnikowia pulcherrima]